MHESSEDFFRSKVFFLPSEALREKKIDCRPLQYHFGGRTRLILIVCSVSLTS
jgi:hypothetical protein